jgi:hypothetical protein
LNKNTEDKKIKGQKEAETEADAESENVDDGEEDI